MLIGKRFVLHSVSRILSGSIQSETGQAHLLFMLFSIIIDLVFTIWLMVFSVSQCVYYGFRDRVGPTSCQ